jgi:hypothetical protein
MASRRNIPACYPETKVCWCAAYIVPHFYMRLHGVELKQICGCNSNKEDLKLIV